MPGESAVRFSGWLCLVLGVACLFAGGVLGILAIQQATEISVYHHARACLAGAPSDADCLQAVEGSVAGVAEFPGEWPGERGLCARRADRIDDAAPHVQFRQPDARLRSGRRP